MSRKGAYAPRHDPVRQISREAHRALIRLNERITQREMLSVLAVSQHTLTELIARGWFSEELATRIETKLAALDAVKESP